MMEFGHFMMEFGHFRTDLSINLMEILPIDPVGVKVSLVLGHLPGLGRVSKPISQKFHFKNGKIYRFTVKITVIYGIFTVFQSQQNRLYVDPCFLQCFAEHPPWLRLIRPDLNCNFGSLYNSLKSLKHLNNN